MAAMSHWEASPFETKDGQDVVKAKGAHVVSEGWEKVVSKDSGGGSSGGSIVASLAAPLGVMPLIGDGSSTSLPHWQKAFLLLVGGFVVYYIRRLLRSKRRPARAAAVNEVGAPRCTALHRPVPSRTDYATCAASSEPAPHHLAPVHRNFPRRRFKSSCVRSHKDRGGASVFKRATALACSIEPRPGQPPLQRGARLLGASFWSRVRGLKAWVGAGESCGAVLFPPRLCIAKNANADADPNPDPIQAALLGKGQRVVERLLSITTTTTAS